MADVYSIVVEFLQKGGVFIFPISLVFVIGVAIAIERWLYLQYEKSRNSKAFNDFLPLLSDDDTDIEKMRAFTLENVAPVTRVIHCGLDMLKVSRQRADIENAMSEGMLETMPRLEQRTNYLGLLANVATLLGLLGTIIGLIGAFEAVAKADPSEKSQLLSTSISVAMNTTAVGLISAIPLLILNGLLQNKTKSIVTSIEMCAVKFLNVMTMNRVIEAGSPRNAGGSSDGGALVPNGADSNPVVEGEEQASIAFNPKARQAKKDHNQPPLSVRLQQAYGSMEAKSGSEQKQAEQSGDSASTALQAGAGNKEQASVVASPSIPVPVQPPVSAFDAPNSQDGSAESVKNNGGHETSVMASNISSNPDQYMGIQVPLSHASLSDQGVNYSQHLHIDGGDIEISPVGNAAEPSGQFVSTGSEVEIPVQFNLGDGISLPEISLNGDSGQVDAEKAKTSKNNNLASGTN